MGFKQQWIGERLSFRFLPGPKTSVKIRTKYRLNPSPQFHDRVVNSANSSCSLLGFKNLSGYPFPNLYCEEMNYYLHCISQDMLGYAAVTNGPPNLSCL